jgi:hypothetical protein
MNNQAQKHYWSIFNLELKKEPKIRMGATRRNLFPKSKNQQDRLGEKSVTNPKGEVSKLNGKGRSGFYIKSSPKSLKLVNI